MTIREERHQYIVLFRGDDSDFVGNQQILLKLETELDLTGCKAHFRFLDFKQDFDEIPADKTLELVFPKSQTAKFPIGAMDAELWLEDSTGKRRTVANRIHVVVTNSVKQAYDNDDPQAITVVITSGNAESVSWDNITEKPSTFPPSAHTHPISQVEGLQGELNQKVNKVQNATVGNLASLTSDGGIQNSGESVASLKEYTNTQVATNTANFLGTYDYATDLGFTPPASSADVDNDAIAAALPSHVEGTPTNNDYVFVVINYTATTPADEFRRFKYNATDSEWLYEYTLNSASFTAAQWEAINSGITGVVAPSSNATTGQAADAKATGDALALRPTKVQMEAEIDPLLFAQYYPEGNVKSAAEFTAGIKYDAPDTTNRTITVKPFCNTGDSDNDNSGLVGRVVIPPFVDAQGNGYISDDGTRFKVVGVSSGAPSGDNTNPTAIIAPNTVTSIGGGAFRGCTNLTSVSLPAATSIGVEAFRSCTSLASISLLSATDIGGGAFRGCTNLTSVSLPAATTIGDFVFYDCTNLTSVDFGDTPRLPVPPLGEDAFSGVPTDCKIVVPDAQYDEWTAEGGWSNLVARGYRFLRHSEWEYARRYEIQDADFVTSVNNKTGAVSLSASDVGALGNTGNQNLNGNLSFWFGNLSFEFWDAVLQPMIRVFDVYIEFPSQSGKLALTSDIPSVAGLAPLASPAFTGTPTAPTPASGDNSTNIATTAFVQSALTPSNTTFSNAVLAVGLNIDTNAVAAINALVEQGQELPIGGATSVGALLLALAAAIAALKKKLPYAIGTATVIDTASSEVVEGETVYYGAATLANRTANIIQVTAATPLDELRITFPAATSGKVRDFGLRVEIGTGSAALTAPALVPIAPTGETIKIENADGAIPELADGTATAKGVTLLYFSETAPGVFVVKGEQVEEVA